MINRSLGPSLNRSLSAVIEICLSFSVHHSPFIIFFSQPALRDPHPHREPAGEGRSPASSNGLKSPLLLNRSLPGPPSLPDLRRLSQICSPTPSTAVPPQSQLSRVMC